MKTVVYAGPADILEVGDVTIPKGVPTEIDDKAVKQLVGYPGISYIKSDAVSDETPPDPSAKKRS